MTNGEHKSHCQQSTKYCKIRMSSLSLTSTIGATLHPDQLENPQSASFSTATNTTTMLILSSVRATSQRSRVPRFHGIVFRSRPIGGGVLAPLNSWQFSGWAWVSPPVTFTIKHDIMPHRTPHARTRTPMACGTGVEARLRSCHDLKLNNLSHGVRRWLRPTSPATGLLVGTLHRMLTWALSVASWTLAHLTAGR